ncbi:MAG: retroviral-like aspartic protease family protein [Steroidobacteraceae bacterium]
MKRGWVGTGFLLATACAAWGAGPAALANSPQATDELTEIVVRAPEPRYVAPTSRDRIGRVWVPVFIDERGPFRLVLDSGATHSAVVPRVAERLGLDTETSPKVLLRGVTGTAIASTVQVGSMTVGDLEVGRTLLPLVPDAFGGAEGLLGTEGMADKRVYIDFRHDFVNISRSKNLRADAGFQALPLIRGAGKLLVVRANIANVRTRAIIDTGAQASIGNPALYAALERRQRRNKGTPDVITGATGDTQIGEGRPISSIELGGLVVNNAHITFGDMHIFNHWEENDQPTILIGMDILGLVDTLVIDYRRQEIHIKARTLGRPPRS